jgi:hypothetical protein
MVTLVLELFVPGLLLLLSLLRLLPPLPKIPPKASVRPLVASLRLPKIRPTRFPMISWTDCLALLMMPRRLLSPSPPPKILKIMLR